MNPHTSEAILIRSEVIIVIIVIIIIIIISHIIADHSPQLTPPVGVRSLLTHYVTASFKLSHN